MSFSRGFWQVWDSDLRETGHAVSCTSVTSAQQPGGPCSKLTKSNCSKEQARPETSRASISHYSCSAPSPGICGGVGTSALGLALFIFSIDQHNYLASIFYNINLWERNNKISICSSHFLHLVAFHLLLELHMHMTCLQVPSHPSDPCLRTQLGISELAHLAGLQLTTWNSSLHFLLLVRQTASSTL